MTQERKMHSYASIETPRAVNEEDRRTTERQLFAATAEVVEEVTGARFATRTMDIGPGGCFIDTTNPLPVGTRVHVKISKGKGDLRTGGVVVYSQNGMGMGVSFLGMTEVQQMDLQTWLAGVVSEKPQISEAPAVAKSPDAIDAKTMRAVTRLLRLLVTKGMLTDAEASSVMHDLVI